MNRRNFLNWLGISGMLSLSPTVIALVMAMTKESFAANLESQAIVFYVALNGNDTWTGKSPTAQGGTGPFATITRARDAIRQLKRQQGGTLKQPVTVFLRGGTYFLQEPLSFTAADSGTKEFAIAYKAYQQEKPIISGGRIIKGWRSITLNDRTVWTAHIPEVEAGKWLFHQLWVNGSRAQRCRYPKTGYLKVDKAPDVTPDMPWQQGQNRFKFRAGDLKSWQEAEQGEAIVMTRWAESRLPIKAIDETSRIVSFHHPSIYRIDPGDSDSSAAGIYYLENIREFLTDPGEWYLEQKSGQLYYIPLSGEQIARSTIIAPVLSKLVNLAGDRTSGQFVEYLSFKNLTFTHGEWYYSQENKRNLGQAAEGIPGTISANRIRFCTWKQCAIAHISHYGINFADACLNNQILDCQFFDLGAGAVKIASHGGHKIVGCHIYNGGLIFHGAVAIWIGNAANNLVTHNHIHDFYYSGISVGWTWGSANSPTASNIIAFNHIHHLGQRTDGHSPLINDNGGIYTLGVQPGTKIRSNLIHDIQARNFGGWGIYLDEGSAQMTVENNIVYNTRTGGFHLHRGEDNIVRNNIFAFGELSQLERTLEDSAKEDFLEDENYQSFTFESNIIYWREGNLLAGQWKDKHYAFDHNLYWHLGDRPIRYDTLSWQEWQQKGMDRHSVIADPLFIAPEQGNFRLKPNSPALKIGFKPLDFVYSA
jgi:parallel beta-helix repeat protein